MQPGGCETWREQVWRGSIVLLNDPEHLAVDTGEDAGGKHGGCRSVVNIGAGAGDFVQRAAGEASAGEGGVEVGQAER